MKRSVIALAAIFIFAASVNTADAQMFRKSSSPYYGGYVYSPAGYYSVPYGTYYQPGNYFTYSGSSLVIPYTPYASSYYTPVYSYPSSLAPYIYHFNYPCSYSYYPTYTGYYGNGMHYSPYFYGR